jgi:redox-sensitive bicupin YhaK (pirin superfamily)
MPKVSKGMMHGLQLWVNLPSKSKMMPPRYRGIVENDVPSVSIPGGQIRVIAGTYQKVTGPVRDLVVDVEYLDVSLTKGSAMEHKPKKGYTTFCYIVEGAGEFYGEKVEQASLALFSGVVNIPVTALENIRYIYVSGKPIKEPIAWGGPIVMNTSEELDLAFQELNEGNFIKQKG